MDDSGILEELYREYDRMLRREDPQTSELKRLIWNYENKTNEEKKNERKPS